MSAIKYVIFSCDWHTRDTLGGNLAGILFAKSESRTGTTDRAPKLKNHNKNALLWDSEKLWSVSGRVEIFDFGKRKGTPIHRTLMSPIVLRRFWNSLWERDPRLDSNAAVVDDWSAHMRDKIRNIVLCIFFSRNIKIQIKLERER